MNDNAIETTSADSGEQPRKPSRPRRPLWLWVILALILIAIIIQASASYTDHQIANLVTYVLAIVAYITAGIGVVRTPDMTSQARLLSVVLLLLLPIGFFSLFRIERVSGDLVPTFRFRFGVHPDELLEVPELTADDADPLETTAGDFSGFLGSRRDARLPDLRIESDWAQQPPRLVWRKDIGAGWSGFSAVSGRAFTLEQRGPTELVTCYDIATGELVWTHAADCRHQTVLGGIGPRSTPTVDEGLVYALGATGILRCLDGASGKPVWVRDLLKDIGVTAKQEAESVAWGRAGSPLIIDQMLVVPYGGPADGPWYSLAALDKTTGETLWKNGDRQISYSSPNVATLAGTRQIIIVNEDNVTGHQVQDGETLWSFSWPGSSHANASASQVVPLPDDHVLVSKGYGGGSALYKISEDGGKWKANLVWEESRLLKTKFTNVAVYGEHVYGLSDGILECVDWREGERKWKRGRYGQGQVLGLADSILVQSERGDVAVVAADANQFRELGRFPALNDQTWNTLCVFDKYLLVRNAREAACYELTVKE